MSNTRIFMFVIVVILSLTMGGMALASDYNPQNEGLTQNTSAEMYPSAKSVDKAEPEAVWPGPDGFGYTGSVFNFNWVDITATGTLVTGWSSLDDGFAGPFPIGFLFYFYGTAQTDFFTNSNGFLSFGTGSTSLSNQCPLPSSTAPDNIIPLLWDDLNLNVSGNAYYQTFDTCPIGPGQCTVVEYYNTAHYGGVAGSAGTWEAILYDNDNLLIQFLDVGVEEGLSSTTGIEDTNYADNWGLTYACNTNASLIDNLAIMFTPPPPTPRYDESSMEAPGEVLPGEPITYTINIYNSGDAPGLQTTMTDTIPMGMIYNGDVTCSSGTCSFDGTNIIWNGQVVALSSVDVTFSVTPDEPECGEIFDNEATITDPSALEPVTVSASTTLVNSAYYQEDFETDDGGYVNMGTNLFTWGPPPQIVAHSGVNAWATDMPYVANAWYELWSPWIDLASASPSTGLLLQWWQDLDIESASYDHAYVEITTDEINWDIAWQHTGGTYHSPGWEKKSIDITPYFGELVKLRFRFTSDSTVQYNGWAIDDVAIRIGCNSDITVDPLMLEATLIPDQLETQQLEVCNVGNAPLSWDIAEVLSGKNPSSPTDIGYAQDIGYISDNFVSFALNDFTGQSVVGLNTDTYYGMDFDPTATTLYALNDTTGQLGTIDLSTGAFTGLVPCPAPVDIWTGLSIDPVTGVFYASTATDLYTIDPLTGITTLIGPFGTSLMIEIAIGPNGDMYGHDIGTDAIYQIDPNTGSTTLIGSTGYDANYAQGMDFDNQDGTLYIWLYQGSGANVYGTVNLTTGAVTPLAVSAPLGEFEGTTQTTAIPAIDILWLSEDPVNGEVMPGACSTIDVTFDSTGLTVGEYTAGLSISSNDWNEPETTIPVTLTVNLNFYLPITFR